MSKRRPISWKQSPASCVDIVRRIDCNSGPPSHMKRSGKSWFPRSNRLVLNEEQDLRKVLFVLVLSIFGALIGAGCGGGSSPSNGPVTSAPTMSGSFVFTVSTPHSYYRRHPPHIYDHECGNASGRNDLWKLFRLYRAVQLGNIGDLVGTETGLWRYRSHGFHRCGCCPDICDCLECNGAIERSRGSRRRFTHSGCL